jgi:glycosyltransferase involved in cell wall biosynthesis
MNKKKIVLLNSSLVGGGTEGVYVSLANSLADKGWHVDLVVLNLYDEAHLRNISNNVNLVVLNVNKVRYSVLSLLKYIYKKKPKVFLVFNYELTVIMVMIRYFFRLNIKIIARNNSTFSQIPNQLSRDNFWKKYVYLPLLKLFYFKSDHIVNQCIAMQEDLISYNPKVISKTNVIYNPVAKYIENYAKNNDLFKIIKKDYILCVGRLEKEKAFHYAIKTFAKLSGEFPKLRLKIVGKGSLEKKLKEFAKEYKVDDRVDFEGFQKNLIPYYIYAKATVLTSLFEGFPNVLIESIALNTPVVAFDCNSGPSEIINNGINGYLVKYQDVEELKKKISTTISGEFYNKKISHTVTRNNLEEVSQNYEKFIISFI